MPPAQFLSEAQRALTDSGPGARMETAILRGPVAKTLACESRDAAMVCVGSTGIGHRAKKFIGATAEAVARSATSPVAIIRRGDLPRPACGEVAAVIDDSRELERILQVALDEARLRRAPLLVLNLTSSRIGELAPEEVDRRLSEFLGRHRDLPTQILMAPDDIPALLTERAAPVQLVVVSCSATPGAP